MQGPWRRVAFGVWGPDERRIVTAEVDKGEGVLKTLSEEEAVANLDLIAEAGTVAYETGLSPRQLADRNAELLSSLKDVLRCLEEHITEEAKEKGESPETLCPCWTTEAAQARALIAEVEKRRLEKVESIHDTRLRIIAEACKDMDSYLAENPKNYVGAGSALHRKIADALRFSEKHRRGPWEFEVGSTIRAHEGAILYVYFINPLEFEDITCLFEVDAGGERNCVVSAPYLREQVDRLGDVPQVLRDLMEAIADANYEGDVCFYTA
jgi:hypothetical protein